MNNRTKESIEISHKFEYYFLINDFLIKKNECMGIFSRRRGGGILSVFILHPFIFSIPDLI